MEFAWHIPVLLLLTASGKNYGSNKGKAQAHICLCATKSSRFFLKKEVMIPRKQLYMHVQEER